MNTNNKVWVLVKWLMNTNNKVYGAGRVTDEHQQRSVCAGKGPDDF